MNLETLFKKNHSFFGLDIGQSSFKLVELRKEGDDRYSVVHQHTAPFNGDIFQNQVLQHPQKLVDALVAVQEIIPLSEKRAVIGLPGRGVFTKKIKIPRVDESELLTTVQFEAANYIPHSIQAVKLDYHVIRSVGKDSLEVLVVAVKNEIIDSYIDAVMMSGINVGIADVDFFALQNVFEANYTELLDKTCALVDIGHRFASVTICKAGESLYTGDISLQSRDAKDIAVDLNRSLSLFWGSSGGDEQIERIFISGGGANIPNMAGAILEKTGIPCEILNPFKLITPLDEAKPATDQVAYAIATGLALRTYGDRVVTT